MIRTGSKHLIVPAAYATCRSQANCFRAEPADGVDVRRIRSGTLGVRSLVRFMVCFLPRAGGEFHQQVWTGNAILLRSPRAEVDQLAAFRAEGTPRIAFPGSWLTAERAGHAGFYHTSEMAGSAGTNGKGGLGLQKSVQAILVDFRQAKELNSELPVSAPANRGRLDSDGRAQVCGTDENTDR